MKPSDLSRRAAMSLIGAGAASALGSAALMILSALIIVGIVLLPNYVGATLSLMGILLLVLAYVFGRVALQVSVGKLFQKHLLSDNSRSETLAVLIGVVLWTTVLSLPYIWLLGLFAVFAVGIGLILTGRTSPRWSSP